MSIERCDSPIEESGRENQIHMDAAFPIVCYQDDLRETAVPWHWHDELELLIVTEGSCVAASEQKEFALSRGDGFFVNAGRLHAMWGLEKGVCRLHSMVFGTRLLGSADQIFFEKYIGPVLENGAMPSLVLHREIPWQCGILRRTEEAWEYCRDEPEGYEWQVRSALSDALYTLWKNMPRDAGENRAYEVRRERLKIMLRYLQENYRNPVTLADLAKQASVSESEVMRCFSAVLKTTPIRFLKNMRLSRGAELLKSGRDSITSVAEQCGFSDTSYFIRSFREKYHCTPGQYRISVSFPDRRIPENGIKNSGKVLR